MNLFKYKARREANNPIKKEKKTLGVDCSKANYKQDLI